MLRMLILNETQVQATTRKLRPGVNVVASIFLNCTWPALAVDWGREMPKCLKSGFFHKFVFQDDFDPHGSRFCGCRALQILQV